MKRTIKELINFAHMTERPDDCRETLPTIEKIEKIVEVHPLQFSFQMVDVQLSRIDELLVIQKWRTPLRRFHTDPVHRQERCCPVL